MDEEDEMDEADSSRNEEEAGPEGRFMDDLVHRHFRVNWHALRASGHQCRHL